MHEECHNKKEEEEKLKKIKKIFLEIFNKEINEE